MKIVLVYKNTIRVNLINSIILNKSIFSTLLNNLCTSSNNNNKA